MAFQCGASDAGQPHRRSASYGGASSVSVSTTASGEGEGDGEQEGEATDAEVDVTAASTASDQVLEATGAQEDDGFGGAAVAMGVSRRASDCHGIDHRSVGAGLERKEEVPAVDVFPHLPPELLAAFPEPPTDKDIENRFTAISTAFKTDKLTLEDRVAVQKRWRDQAEINLAHEEQSLRAAVQNLYYLCKDANSVEIVTKVKEQIDVLRRAIEWVARSSESVGAIQQETRVSKAMEVMLQYVENLKRIRGKQDEEGKKRSKHQSEDLADTDDTVGRTVRYRSLQPLPGMVKSGSKRRASIAAIPRPPVSYVEASRASISISPLYMEGSPRFVSHSVPFARRTSLTPSAAPSSPSTTSWGSSDNLDLFESTTNTFMDNIEEISESRRESYSNRLEVEENVTPEENNNCSLKRPSFDDAPKTSPLDVKSTKNVSVFNEIYANYEKYMNAVEAARDTVMDHLDTDNIMIVARKAVASLLILAAIYYLIAMFFEPAEAVHLTESQHSSSFSAEKHANFH